MEINTWLIHEYYIYRIHDKYMTNTLIKHTFVYWNKYITNTYKIHILKTEQIHKTYIIHEKYMKNTLRTIYVFLMYSIKNKVQMYKNMRNTLKIHRKYMFYENTWEIHWTYMSFFHQIHEKYMSNTWEIHRHFTSVLK